MSRTLQSRVLALTGAGVFVAATALSLLSRQSLLTLEARVRAERQTMAGMASGVLARDLVADLEVLQGVVSSPHVQQPETIADVWVRELAAASLGLRLGDGVCRTDRTGVATTCASETLARRVAHPELIASICEAISMRRPVVSPFVAQADGALDAIAAMPMPGTDPRAGAIVEVISSRAPTIQQLFSTGSGLSVTAETTREAAGARVSGTPWTVSAAAAPDVAETIAAFRRRTLWFPPALTSLALVLAWGIVASVRRPLAELTGSADRIAAGNLRDPIPSGSDEIGRLATALDHMRVRLLQRLLAKTISAQEDERRRVARELHDETSQVLAALGMALHAPGAVTPERIAELRALVDRMHEGLHRLIVNLRPSVIDDLGLGAAIEALANAHLRRAGLAVRCELGDLQDRRVDAAIEIAVFRVVQEAILNVARHADASTVIVEGGVTNGRLWIEIEDDGRGFDPASIAPDERTLRGIGLIGMRERVEMLGGRFDIDSAPGQGTRVRIDVAVAS